MASIEERVAKAMDRFWEIYHEEDDKAVVKSLDEYYGNDDDDEKAEKVYDDEHVKVVEKAVAAFVEAMK